MAFSLFRIAQLFCTWCFKWTGWKESRKKGWSPFNINIGIFPKLIPLQNTWLKSLDSFLVYHLLGNLEGKCHFFCLAGHCINTRTSARPGLFQVVNNLAEWLELTLSILCNVTQQLRVHFCQTLWSYKTIGTYNLCL